MKVFVTFIIVCSSLFSFGQENSIQKIAIQWEQLGAPLLYLEEEPITTKYKLMEIDLSVNLREQFLNKNRGPLMMLPENKFIQPDYTVAIPGSQTKNIGFRVSGNGYNTNRRGRSSSGSIKNNAYKDAGFYNGEFCPITGFAL